MSRARNFTRAEIRDAALAAAESGLRVLLRQSGDIEFTPPVDKRKNNPKTPEDYLEEYISGRQAGGRA